MKALVIFILLSTQVLVESCVFENEVCTCNSSINFQILCSKKSSYKILDLSKLNFSSNGKLMHISIHYKTIESIEPIAIADVIELDISNGLIKQIINKPFRHLNKLERLRLASNQIEFIEDGSFENLSSLQKLWLLSNKLSYIKNGTFAGLRNLNLLVLRTNEIEYIEAGAFQHLKNITDIWLYCNGVYRGLLIRWSF